MVLWTSSQDVALGGRVETLWAGGQVRSMPFELGERARPFGFRPGRGEREEGRPLGLGDRSRPFGLSDGLRSFGPRARLRPSDSLRWFGWTEVSRRRRNDSKAQGIALGQRHNQINSVTM